MKTLITLTALLLLASCASQEQKDRDFTTSGNRDADQRAESRISKTQQMRGEGAKEGGINPNANTKASLYERLGGEKGLVAITDDWVQRMMNDPRVNFERKGVKRGGMMGVGGREKVWQPTDEMMGHLKKHFVQFFSLSTGGPTKYDGYDMKASHDGMKITNSEFDAAVGDLKVTLDRLRIATEAQKELLAIVETTREQIVAER